ncbi:MAG: zinc ribbon domain-containing protein [Blastochloris sp.]|nr:zinc ribbon domain-containing protein [Blastochloris sp.]
MPTYVYACESCGAQFERFQSFKEEPLRTCPCGKEGAVRRVFQPVGIVFKGAGWYVTDSRSTNSASVKSDDSSGKTETTETKSDTTTPETKSDTTASETKSAPSAPETKSSSASASTQQ